MKGLIFKSVILFAVAFSTDCFIIGSRKTCNKFHECMITMNVFLREKSQSQAKYS